MPTEIEYTLTQRASLTDKTKRGYADTYKRLRALLTHDVIDTNEEKLIEVIDDAREEDKKTHELKELTASVKLTLLNVAIVIRQVYNKGVKELEQYRVQGKKNLLTANVLRNEGAKGDLPSLKELMDYTNTLYSEGEYHKYIINYLILTFNTRNMDLNLLITRDSKKVNHKDNWIVLLKDRARYLRYVYKTADTYDCKENEITSKNVLEALRIILGDKDEQPLLTKSDGTRIAVSSLNNIISRATLKNEKFANGIGQANYLKILLADKGTMKTFEKVSANRGTSLNALNEYYNTGFKNDAVKTATKAKTACKKIPADEKGAVKKTKKKEAKAKEIEQSHALLKPAEEPKAEPAKKTIKIKKKKLIVVE